MPILDAGFAELPAQEYLSAARHGREIHHAQPPVTKFDTDVGEFFETASQTFHRVGQPPTAPVDAGALATGSRSFDDLLKVEHLLMTDNHIRDNSTDEDQRPIRSFDGEMPTLYGRCLCGPI